MSELSERIEVLSTCGFVDDSGKRDLEAIARVLTEECGVDEDNEVLGTLVTHVAAALKRARDGEKINPLSPDIVDDVKASPVYQEAVRIQSELLEAMENDLSDDERDFVLVHIGGLLMSQATE